MDRLVKEAIEIRLKNNFNGGSGFILTIRDGRHVKHRQNGRVVFYATGGVFILHNATSQF